jgi:hypothetical protein
MGWGRGTTVLPKESKGDSREAEMPDAWSSRVDAGEMVALLAWLVAVTVVALVVPGENPVMLS